MTKQEVLENYKLAAECLKHKVYSGRNRSAVELEMASDKKMLQMYKVVISVLEESIEREQEKEND